MRICNQGDLIFQKVALAIIRDREIGPHCIPPAWHYSQIIETASGVKRQLVPWEGQQRKIITKKKKDTKVRTKSAIITNDSKNSIPTRASSRRVAIIFYSFGTFDAHLHYRQ